MKVLHAGNMANLGYVIAKFSREEGIESELLMDKNPHKLSDPLIFEPNLTKYPPWIYFYNRSSIKWKLDIIRKMRSKKYDIIHAYVELPIFAYLSCRTFLSYTQGSDMRELAFSNSLRGRLLRLAYKKSKVVLIGQPDHLPLTKKLGLQNTIFFPAPWISEQRKISSENKSHSLIIFHPSSLDWRLKGNNILIRGFAKYVQNNTDSLLLLTERGCDLQKTKELIKSLEIEKYVKFLPTLNQEQMSKYYFSSDVVADQFIIGSMGGISLEALFCGKPLLTYINEDIHKSVYSEIPPVSNAKNSVEIFLRLIELGDKNFQKNLGEKGRRWALKFHSPSSIIPKLKIIYESILNNEPVKKIKEKIIFD